MKTYDLYGLESGDIEAVRLIVEAALGIKLASHESSYIGDYYLGFASEEEIRLRNNLDPIDGEPVNSELPQSGLLLYVDKAQHQRAREIEKALLTNIPDLRLLSRKEF